MQTQTKKFLRQLIGDEAFRKRITGPLLFSCAVCYLAFHALNGERGLYAYFKQSRNLEVSQTELSKLKKQRAIMEQRVTALSNGSLDLDLLDEEARRVLGTANKNEVVVLTAPR